MTAIVTQVAADTVRVAPGVGAGGSAGEAQRAILRDGSSVMILPLAVCEGASIVDRFASRFARLGPETLYARSRFTSRARRPPRPRGDHGALSRRSGDWERAPHRVEEATSAEVTVTVSNPWQRRDLASVLLERVAASARSVGIEQLTARCLASELTLIRLLSRLGLTIVDRSGAGRVDVRIQLI